MDNYQFSRDGRHFYMQNQDCVTIYRIKLNSIGKMSFYVKNEYKIEIENLNFSKDNNNLIGIQILKNGDTIIKK